MGDPLVLAGILVFDPLVLPAFLEREIGKPIIRCEDSPQLGYEILPKKYFYHYQLLSLLLNYYKSFGRWNRKRSPY